MAWWKNAGVDTIVSDEPRSWLEAPKTPAKKMTAKADIPEPAPVRNLAEMPSDLSAFREWMLSTDVLSMPAADRLDAIGNPVGGLMILVDMPEQGDCEAGGMLSGPAGLLFDRMLAAIGRDRTSAYVAALSPARIAGGTIDDNSLRMLTPIARRHVALAKPRHLLTMGDAPSRVFCEASLKESRGKQHIFNHDGDTVSVTATFHPRFLLRQSRFKAQSWDDLQMLIEGVTA